MYFGPALRSTPQYQLPSGALGIPPEPPAQPSIAGILATLWRRKKVLAAIFVAFFALVVLFTLIVPKQYTATIKIIAGASSPQAGPPTDTTLPLLNALLAANNTMSSETYIDLIQEYPVAEQVIGTLHLPTDPYDLFQNNVSVTPVTNSSIIALSATWGDAKTAMAIANEFGRVFVNRQRDLIAGQAGSALDFLTKQLPLAEATMRKSDAALAQFEAAHPNVYIASADSQSETSSIFAAQQKYATTQVDRGQAQAQLDNVMGQLGTVAPTINGQSTIVQNPVTAQLQTQLAQVDVQLQDALKQYTEQHPTVVALKEQKAQLEREIRSQSPTIVSGKDIQPNPVYQQLSQQAANLRSQLAGDDAQMKTLDAELGRANGAGSLPAQSMELANLQRKAKMAEDIYTALQQKYGQAVVAQTTALADVAVTQPATRDTVRVKPNWKTNLLLGVILGLVMAISGVFIVDFFDNTFKDEDDVQRAIALPLLATIPQLTTKAPRKLPWQRKAAPNKLPWLRALTVESFLQLVTALRYSSDKPLRSLAITSPAQRDGKTTVAMSTAIAMAEMEPKVLLIDADLRSSSLHERLDVPAGPGLSEVLVGAAELSEAIVATKYDGLYLLRGGAKAPNPVKLIHSARFDELVTTLLKDYRTLIFDTPALEPVYDAAILAAKVDGTVLVVSAGMTNLASTKRTLQRLSSVQGVNLLGIVLNRVAPSNGYGHYYLNGGSAIPLPHENGVASRS